MIQITVCTASGEIIAQSSHESEAMLCFDRRYEPGDFIEITASASHLWLQPDASILPGEVYLPDGHMRWPVPAGIDRLAYCPGAFETPRHIVTARAMTAQEISCRRNLARNPADLRGDTDFFPHCTANAETRGESCFAARGVINGLRFNTFHGEWPYLSWGVDIHEDARCTIDFGREVEIDQMALTLRADFPHDAHWVRGRAVLSDGAEIPFPLEKTGDRQFIPLGCHRVRWIRLQDLIKSDDPSEFPALAEWEVFGADLNDR